MHNYLYKSSKFKKEKKKHLPQSHDEFEYFQPNLPSFQRGEGLWMFIVVFQVLQQDGCKFAREKRREADTAWA